MTLTSVLSVSPLEQPGRLGVQANWNDMPMKHQILRWYCLAEINKSDVQHESQLLSVITTEAKSRVTQLH
jgi:hypothetical protein